MTQRIDLPRTVVFALCGSFCTFGAVLPQIQALVGRGWQVLPALSWGGGAAGHPLWHGRKLAPAADRTDRPCAHRHAAAGGAAGPPADGLRHGGGPLHRHHAGKAGPGAERHAGDHGGQKPAAAGAAGGGGALHQRRPGRQRRPHCGAFAAQAFLFCALWPGRQHPQAQQPEKAT